MVLTCTVGNTCEFPQWTDSIIQTISIKFHIPEDKGEYISQKSTSYLCFFVVNSIAYHILSYSDIPTFITIP